ncbi:MAG: MBL fold metallo-hydrolase [Candidatus Abyssobacteria bacterium SURF_5]|uniref:MBL fold metallo-hydrolase n=1 Tax=Abyssobacteria bacterium (strain SURF_5) TaxID=2093360 RepID=A0A3A4P2C1_ABYX5|nr:MAG: MBL fold metallo-hydrolase [Candidatus Abyssubacteria bacterium SURF_5]
MDVSSRLLRAGDASGSGRVREYRLGGDRRLVQITTFCPSVIGPGPTHLYLIIDEEIIILVDTGIPTNLAKDLFYYWRNQRIPAEVEALPDNHSEQQLLSALALAGVDPKTIDFLVITHGHPDHYLLGRRIVELSGARVAAHVSDSHQITNPWAMVKFWVERRPALMAIGMPPPKQGGRSNASANPETTDLSLRVDCPIAFDGRLRLDNFEKDWLCVRHYAGHSPGGIGLFVYDQSEKESIFLCGDTLLYPITPHPDDLIAYLRTLKYMKDLKDVAIVLPAHGKAILKLHERLEFLDKHHEHRLRLTYDACRKPRSIWEIATMRRYFDVHVDPTKFNPLAGQEAFVHVELLQIAGGLRRSHIDGFVHYFINSGEKFEDVYARIQSIINDENSTILLRR